MGSAELVQIFSSTLIAYLSGRLVIAIAPMFREKAAHENASQPGPARWMFKFKSWFRSKSLDTNYRRVGANGIPLFGGVGIYLAVGCANFLINDPLLLAITISFFPTFICGFLDDIFELKARVRLIGQILFPVLFIFVYGAENLIYSKFGFGPIFGSLISGLFLVTLSNAFNFLDGIDGQVGTLAMAIFATLALAFPEARALGTVGFFSCLGFYILNFPPAKIYLGEVGSSFLGMATGALTLSLPMKNNPYFVFWGINFLYGIAFCDLLMAITRRIRKGLAPWASDREHFHHKLLAMGIKKQVVLGITSFISVSSCVTGAILFFIKEPLLAHALIAVNASTLLFIFLGLMLGYKFTGKRFSHMGRTLLEKYIQFESNLNKVELGDNAILIDLLPYFTELQGKGVLVVQEFVIEVAEFTTGFKPAISINLLGSYTILIFTGNEYKMTQSMKTNFSQSLYDIFLKFNVVRTMSVIPEGLQFYQNIDSDLLMKFGKTAPVKVDSSESIILDHAG